MRYHRSKRTLLDLKCGACHFIFNLLSVITALGLAVYATVYYDLPTLYIAVITGAVWMISSFVYLLKANSLRCPLCLVPIYAHKRCTKNREAKQIMGSYRLAVSLSILCRGHYRCIYCGELFNVTNIEPNEPKH